MINIGIITNRHYSGKKLHDLIEYLKSKVNVSLYLEEEYLLNGNSTLKYDEDLFFVKGKQEFVLNLVKVIEKSTSIPIINSYQSIWLAINRFMNSMLIKKTGVPIPKFSMNPANFEAPFKDYIIKNSIDQKSSDFRGKIEKKDGHLQVKDERAIKEAHSGIEDCYFLYYQKFIKSKYEYKIYCLGEKFYYYKQYPILINPNTKETRKQTAEKPDLREHAIKAMEALDLKIASVDFLKDIEGNYYLTDINSSPDFNKVENGPKIIGDYLINQAKS